MIYLTETISNISPVIASVSEAIPNLMEHEIASSLPLLAMTVCIIFLLLKSSGNSVSWDRALYLLRFVKIGFMRLLFNILYILMGLLMQEIPLPSFVLIGTNRDFQGRLGSPLPEGDASANRGGASWCVSLPALCANG